MRVLVYLHSFGPGGVERVALRLSGAWASSGHDVRVLMGRRDGPDRSVAPDNVLYDFAPAHSLARPFETFWMVGHLIAAIRRHRPDVLFCAGNTYTVVAALTRLILGRKCPPIVSKFSNSLNRRDLPAPIRIAHRIWLRMHPAFIQQFVGLSKPMEKEIAHLVGVGSDRVTIIPNPVLTLADVDELSAARPDDLDRGGRQFVAVGRLSRQKNFSLLLRAFARIADPEDRLLIVGDGPERKRLQRLAEKLGISASVDLPGHKASVTSFLKTADVFVMSSDYEGMPAAVVEALAAGVSIIATDSSPSLGELLRGGELGRLVPIRDVASLAYALANAPGRESLPLEEMRSTAALYTVEGSTRLYLDVLTAAVSERSRIAGPAQVGPLAEPA
jgi:glycosyltransferase involved in cell wall biosynthesis